MKITFIFSTVTLFAEILVSTGILYAFYSAYKRNKFPSRLVAIVLAYEILFNITYMTYRAASNVQNEPLMPHFILALAIFHGIFSLIMFLALLLFMGLAWFNYRKGINYFAKHKVLTVTFIVCWLIAVFSGIWFYFVAYFH